MERIRTEVVLELVLHVGEGGLEEEGVGVGGGGGGGVVGDVRGERLTAGHLEQLVQLVVQLAVDRPDLLQHQSGPLFVQHGSQVSALEGTGDEGREGGKRGQTGS